MALFRRKRSQPDAPAEKRSQFPTIPFHQVLAAWPSTAAGVSVTTESAMRSAAVAACVRVLKTTVAQLPVDQGRAEGTRRVQRPASQVVLKPSARVSRRAWVAQNMHSFLTDGNVYGQVVAYDRLTGLPTQVESLAPRDVHWRSTGDGVSVPYVRNEPKDIWPLGDLVHIPASAFLRPGCVVADSPVDLAKESIGTSLAAERFGAQFFGDGAHPSAIIRSDQELDEPAAKNVKNAVLGAMVGREPAVLGSGLEYDQIQINPSDSQFLDLLRFECEQAARFFGVPPAMIYAAVSGQSVTYANVNQADLQYLKYSVAIWLADLEDAWSAWVAPDTVKFNVNALLRMDTPSRFTVYDKAIRTGIYSVNDVRTLEDLEPIPDGDEYLWPPYRAFPIDTDEDA